MVQNEKWITAKNCSTLPFCAKCRWRRRLLPWRTDAPDGHGNYHNWPLNWTALDETSATLGLRSWFVCSPFPRTRPLRPITGFLVFWVLGFLGSGDPGFLVSWVPGFLGSWVPLSSTLKRQTSVHSGTYGQWFTDRVPTKRTHPVSGSCLKENALPEVRGHAQTDGNQRSSNSNDHTHGGSRLSSSSFGFQRSHILSEKRVFQQKKKKNIPAIWSYLLSRHSESNHRGDLNGPLVSDESYNLMSRIKCKLKI